MKGRLILIALTVGALASAGPITQTLGLNGGGTFLARSSNDNTQAGSFYTPVDFNLSGLGLAAGDSIEITFTGTVCFSGASMCLSPGLLGLFSSSSSSSTPVANVDGLPDVTTSEFYNSSGVHPGPDNTNTFDFGVPNGLILTIPTGGTNLFIGINDSFFSDNTGNASITLTQVLPQAVPEPAAYGLVLVGLGALVARKRFTRS